MIKALKYKKSVTVSIVIISLFLMFLISKKIANRNLNQTTQGLGYQNIKQKETKETVGDLIQKDTDGDGILDWEEKLWGTDINKKDTNDDGINDAQDIAQRKLALGKDEKGKGDKEGLTQTDEFARSLFITATALSQEGKISEEGAEKLGSALAEQIQNQVVKKVYLISDLKINDKTDIKKYRESLYNLRNKNPIKGDINVILKKFVETDDTGVLKNLDPIIQTMQKHIDGMLMINTPTKIGELHLNIINEYQKIIENLSNLKLADIDPVVAMGAISQYPKSVASFNSANEKLTNAIK